MKEPVFKGEDNYDQLEKINQVLGTKELLTYLAKYDIELNSNYDTVLLKHKSKPLTNFITDANKHRVSVEAMDLISKMLVYDHTERITAKEAMEHPYFAPVYEHSANKKETMATD